MKLLKILVLIFSILNSISSDSQEEANLRKNISLSFRQVNSFNLNDLSFKLFALTSQPIVDSNLTIEFSIYHMKGTEKKDSQSLATCHIADTVANISELGIEPVSFNCEFLKLTLLQ